MTAFSVLEGRAELLGGFQVQFYIFFSLNTICSVYICVFFLCHDFFFFFKFEKSKTATLSNLYPLDVTGMGLQHG